MAEYSECIVLELFASVLSFLLHQTLHSLPHHHLRPKVNSARNPHLLISPVSITNIITTTTTIAKLINMEHMEVFEKICSELEAARKEITRLDLENQAKQTEIHELSAESTRNMNMWQFQKNLVHEFVKEAEIIELKETVSKQEIRELENDLVVKNEELRLIRGRESEDVQKIKELEQVVKSLEMQNSRLEEDIEAQSCHTE
ncbi:hypothetical protein D6D25_08991 [Aureobasidium pullulans]|nr:hypothetical protein D6D25_08991 [Aureobasidium pullulans]